MKLFRQISIFFVSIALAVLLLPEVFQVSFHDHEHTEDVERTCCDFHIEELHNHCLEVDFYVISVYFTGGSFIEFAQQYVQLEQIFKYNLEWVEICITSLRGPPIYTS